MDNFILCPDSYSYQSLSNSPILDLLVILPLTILPNLISPLIALSQQELNIGNTEEQLNNWELLSDSSI